MMAAAGPEGSRLASANSRSTGAAILITCAVWNADGDVADPAGGKVGRADRDTSCCPGSA